eukprot:4679013-Prymnesium_polylepis.1
MLSSRDGMPPPLHAGPPHGPRARVRGRGPSPARTPRRPRAAPHLTCRARLRRLPRHFTSHEAWSAQEMPHRVLGRVAAHRGASGCWLEWPQLKEPLDPSSAAYIACLDPGTEVRRWHAHA